MASITISQISYSKILLHAAKYPHNDINGILLADQKSCQEDAYRITDSIPLFHLDLALSPMMEVALNQVEAYCSAEGKHIVGYYQANHHIENSSPNSISFRIIEQIQKYCPQACLLMVNNKSLANKGNALDLYCKVEGKWKLDNLKMTLDNGSDELAKSMIERKNYRRLNDFDNHLDDISCSYYNKEINFLVTSEA